MGVWKISINLEEEFFQLRGEGIYNAQMGDEIVEKLRRPDIEELSFLNEGDSPTVKAAGRLQRLPLLNL